MNITKKISIWIYYKFGKEIKEEQVKMVLVLVIIVAFGVIFFLLTNLQSFSLFPDSGGEQVLPNAPADAISPEVMNKMMEQSNMPR